MTISRFKSVHLMQQLTRLTLAVGLQLCVVVAEQTIARRRAGTLNARVVTLKTDGQCANSARIVQRFALVSTAPVRHGGIGLIKR